MLIVPVLDADASNVEEVLEAQALHLVGNGVPRRSGRSSVRYFDAVMKKVKAFTYSEMMAATGLRDVMVVDYGVPLCHLVEAGRVGTWISPDQIMNFGDVVLPDDIAIVQFQAGRKYRRMLPITVRNGDHDEREALGTVTEALHAHLYWGRPLLERCQIELPGSVTHDAKIPFLGFASDGATVLGALSTGAVYQPNAGSMTVYRSS